MFGIKQKSFEILKAIFIVHNVDKAIIFGSRAKGNYKETSDINIAILGDFTSTEINLIKWDIEEGSIVYNMDLIHYESITNKELKKSVDKGKFFPIN